MSYKKYFVYCEQTGDLVWRKRSVSDFSSRRLALAWNSKNAGATAGSMKLDAKGQKMYPVVRLGTRTLYAHRIIWEMKNGPIPEGLSIDHIDGNRWNNVTSNLRLVTPSQNCINRAAPNNNTSGRVGVYPMKNSDKWKACIGVSGQYIHLGVFQTKQEAIDARARAEATYHGNYVRQAANNEQEPISDVAM